MGRSVHVGLQLGGQQGKEAHVALITYVSVELYVLLCPSVVQATFWGAGSSNRLAFIHPVMASTTNPGAVATARLRASNPGVWNRPAQWHQNVGVTVAGAVCKPACPNLTTAGFRGTEWPSAGMPLGDGRLASSDLQTRFTGGLLATNLIQYFEYSQNSTTLSRTIYPFVKDVAEFYLSYAEKGRDGKLMFPYSCAQEGCACRDAGFVKVPSVPVPNSTLQCRDRSSPQMGNGTGRCPTANGWMLNHPCYECEPDIATRCVPMVSDPRSKCSAAGFGAMWVRSHPAPPRELRFRGAPAAHRGQFTERPPCLIEASTQNLSFGHVMEPGHLFADHIQRRASKSLN